MSPLYLLQHFLVKTKNLIDIVTLCWELPEDFLHGLYKHWVSKVENVHAHYIQIQEVKKQILNLNLLNSYSNEIAKLEISKHFVPKE